MAKKKASSKTVATLTHDEATRKNIPTAEYQSVVPEEQRSPIQVAYERRNPDLDPQLVWRGKDLQDWSDLVVNAPPLYIQEKIHPKVLIDDLVKQTATHQTQHTKQQLDLFADFNGIPEEARGTEFYQHDAHWSNRMILGDSLQVMASLAEREGLRGKVQCIYLDPPYGIKFNSNFQWSTTSRDVKDGKLDHITREPEQVKAFRDTWRDGIHSYLTYLRDRLTVARDLLTDSGSIFVQIGDENVHRVRAVMDEVFGEENFVSLITIQTSGGLGASLLKNVTDYVIWFCRNREQVKFRKALLRIMPREGRTTGERYDRALLPTGQTITSKDFSRFDLDDARFYQHVSLISSGYTPTCIYPFNHCGRTFTSSNKRSWKPNRSGMERLQKAARIEAPGETIRYVRYLEDFAAYELRNVWTDIAIGTDKTYVVQTSPTAIQRCLLMATDPGDLVLDPTCGSGTTAYVAEQWGRRWITIDTSRVALALARARIMGARYPYYLLADSPEGLYKEAELSQSDPSIVPTNGDIRHGFVYERVPHITLKSIANNAEIDVIWEKWEQRLAPLRDQLSVASDQKNTLEEWEIPRQRPDHWPPATNHLLEEFWKARIARQKEIDASIAAKAEYEYLYDKPYTDKSKVRVAGPFTVESISPHRVLTVDENDELIDPLETVAKQTGGEQGFIQAILENLKTAGVQQAHKEDRIEFTSLAPWPGKYLCAEGRFQQGESSFGQDLQDEQDEKKQEQNPVNPVNPVEKRAGIFIGPEFGTVSRQDLVLASREAADAGFDVVVACAFSYDAHSAEFNQLGRVRVLKARINADMHMADSLKNTGQGNLFVIFGEPDIIVTCGQWLVTRNGRLVANYEQVRQLSGLGSLEEINRSGRDGVSHLVKVSAGREIRADEPDSPGGGVGTGKHRRGGGAERNAGVPSVPRNRERIAGGDGNVSDSGGGVANRAGGSDSTDSRSSVGGGADAQRSQTLVALEDLTAADFPFSLTTNHQTQVTILGVDVFHPNTGKIESDSTDGIACWFIDTDYNEESFFVRHAYFLGASDPYKSLKTTLKAEINSDAWESLHSDTSRPFDKPKGGRIAVKVINHLGDEVMKVFGVE